MSVIDLAMIEAGRPRTEILSNMITVARRVEQLGYRRIWYAEHHAAVAIEEFPPLIVMTHVAAVTSTIRVGSGGVLAPNHVPLVVAEQVGTLAALHPGRVDLGIGRGPGTLDERVARALRRGAAPPTDAEYAGDVAEILRLAGERPDVPEPWLLSSSLAGTAIAARLGLPLVFAHHMSPDTTAEAVETYRDRFQPSRWADAPQVIVSVLTVCADTEAEALRLARPFDVVFGAAREGRERALPSPDDAATEVLTGSAEEFARNFWSRQACGDRATAVGRLAELAARYDADELMLATPVYDPEARIHSFELVASHAALTG